MKNEPLWAMAAGCVPDANPWDIPRISHAAGFRSCGMWVDPDTNWDAGALAKTKTAIAETGMHLIDVEVIWLGEQIQPTENARRIVDVGLELGARNVLVVTRHTHWDQAVKQFRELCKLAGPEMRIVLEFGEFTSVKSLADAEAFVREVEHPAAGILIDMMHINRSGETLPALTDNRFPYVQACDFLAASRHLTGSDYISAAVDDRFPLGEGEVDHQILKTVCSSEVDVSLEIRSKLLRDQYPNPYQRAVQIFQRCQRKQN